MKNTPPYLASMAEKIPFLLIWTRVEKAKEERPSIIFMQACIGAPTKALGKEDNLLKSDFDPIYDQFCPLLVLEGWKT